MISDNPSPEKADRFLMWRSKAMMKITSNRAYLLSFAILTILFLQSGCTRTETGNRVSSEPEPVARESSRAIEPDVQPLAGELEDVYDIDEELLEEDEIGDETELLDSLEKTARDTFSVKDINEVAPSVEKFAKGYRVQVFASSDLEKAREFKKIFMAGTGLAVYIDYEGGLYKVRAGDYSGREEASEARLRLAEQYPDCWIVKTTIKKQQ